MKCDKCGFIPNPGDQVCINCGEKLSFVNAIVPELEEVKVEENKSNKNFVLYVILGIVALIIIIFLIIKFVVLKG